MPFKPMSISKLCIYITIINVLILSSCIDPYTPKLAGYKTLLIVDGMITDENSAYTIRLSNTLQDQNADPIMISDATVSVTDDIGNIFYLTSKGNGLYRSDSTVFRGNVGRKYVLHILTKENEEYESVPCLMKPVAEIDSIYIARDEQLVNNSTESDEGISIYLDSKKGSSNSYYRWAFEEAWKFRVPNPQRYVYIKTKLPDFPLILPIPTNDIKEFCWKYRRSDEILVRSIKEWQSGKIEKQPIYFISSLKSDRLLLEYSILVKQYSLSPEEYEFWNNLKQVNIGGGDIFARQPYAVISNIHRTNDPDERVLGYFQVSAVKQKIKNIPYRDVALMGLHFYSNTCKTWQYNPLDFETKCRCPPKTWDDVYWYLSIQSDYTFVRPIYFYADSLLVKMEFTRPECGNCEVTGSRARTDFWNEIK